MATSKQKDPVCNMELEVDEAQAKSQFRGQTYYFCSPECREEFEESPQEYAQRNVA